MLILLPVRFEPESWLGGSNYFRSLVSAVARNQTDGIQLCVATNRPDAFTHFVHTNVQVVWAPWLVPTKNVGERLNRLVEKYSSVNIRLQLLARKMGASLITHHAPNRPSVCPVLYWMPDFQHCHYPEHFSAAERKNRDTKVLRTAAQGHILVSSYNAEQDLRRFYPGLAAVESHVLRFTPDLELVQAEVAVPKTAHIAKRSDHFFLLPNQFWIHKNHDVVVEALRMLPTSVRVVCTGALTDHRGSGHIDALLEKVKANTLGERFCILGTVPRGQLQALMQSAIAVLNPSYFEGWSTTIEEAKGLGKRAILSDIPVHREQDPPDALYFDPDDPIGLARAMTQVLNEFSADLETARAAAAKEIHANAVGTFADTYARICLQVAAEQQRIP